MGTGASVGGNGEATVEEAPKPLEVHLKKLPEAVEEALYGDEKFPLIIDPTEQAGRFFKYQTGTFISMDDPIQSKKENINVSLVGAFRFGRSLTLKFNSLEGVNEDIFSPGYCPVELLDRSKFFLEENWQSVLTPASITDGAEKSEITISSEFSFIVITNTEYVPPALFDTMKVIKVVDKSAESAAAAAAGQEQDPMDQIAELFGAKEVVRVSLQLVEAAFDGDLEEVKSWLEKGYHLESMDGRKHTALSEAACQGHMHVVQYLLEIGADPNSLSDTGRSALWRASFNGHLDVAKALLEAGTSPEHRDRVSMETAFDVAQSEELRQLLSDWDISQTEKLMEERKRVILANLESRIKTSAEREFYARNLIRKELVDKATNGDVEGIKQLLEEVVCEAQQTDTLGKPRAGVEVRNDSGQSLLSIAAQYEYVELAEYLLTYWKEVDKDRWDLTEGEVSQEAKIYKPNVNSRDFKGWTCACIAVFHDSRKVLQLLLEHGADPNIRSSYNKNAWDLSKDELDAAEKVTKSNKEIRQVLLDYDQTGSASAQLSGAGAGNGIITNSEEHMKKILYDGLGADGSPVVMNIEMNKEGLGKNSKSTSSNSGKGTAGTGKAATGKKSGGSKTGGGGGGGGKKKATGGKK